MLYLIGLGLNEKGISLEGLEAVKKCEKVYLESYTVDFLYPKENLEKIIGKKISISDREFVENLKILNEAKNVDIALLVYGSPLMATTHITINEEAEKRKVRVKVIQAASVFDAVAETGLQLYKFGKIISIPKWQENYNPESFVNIIKENKKINAHSLILVDIGLELKDALEQMEISARNKKMKIGKIIVCSRLGTKDSKIIYDKIENLKNENIKKPFCIIIPGRLQFYEKSVLKDF